MKKALLIMFIPFLPFAILIDILIGDIMTGVKTSVKEKMISHVRIFKQEWNT